MNKVYNWLFNITINVKLVEIDFLELKYSPNKVDTEIIHWEKIFTNRISYWLDKYICNYKKYKETNNIHTPVPVLITIRKNEILNVDSN